MWYDPSITLSHNCLFNFVLGARSAGKTFNTILYAFNQFKKTMNTDSPYEIAYVRRYKPETKATKPKLMSAISAEGYMDGYEYKVQGDTGYVNKKPFVNFFTLSTAAGLKSVPYPNVKLIIFDEFLIDSHMIHYIPNEVDMFFELYQTIARQRDVRVLFLANSISQTNPYFIKLGIKPTNKEFTKIKNLDGSKDILLHLWQDTGQADARKASRFGKIIAGTNYADYSIDNQFWMDNDNFIEKRTPKAALKFCFRYLGKDYSVWSDISAGKVFIEAKGNTQNQITYVFTKADMTPNTILAMTFKHGYHFKLMQTALATGCLYFDSINTKNIWYEITRIMAL